MNWLQRSLMLARARPWYTAGIIVVLLLSIIIAHHFLSAPASSSAPRNDMSHVTIESVAALSQSAGPLSIVGTVKSESQATILAQTAGEVTSLNHTIGDHVAAGDVIGTFENSSQQAALTQAQGQYESAQAALAKAQGSTAQNSGITSAQAQTTLQNDAAALSAALASTYAALDDAVHTKADTLITNPRTANPQLGFLVPDSQLTSKIQTERQLLEATLSDANTAASASDLDAGAKTILADAQKAQLFLNDLITALNKAVPDTTLSATQITTAQATLSAARSEVNAALSALTAAKSAYDGAAASAQSAQNSANTGTQNDIATAQAALKSALGGVNAARASLEKTIIRSPISGTIVSLPITQGDYVSSFTQVAIVSNPGALYVDAQITQDDARTLAVGTGATVDGAISGVITFIAPALNPTTGKVEVKVGLRSDSSNLSNGQAVTVALARSAAPVRTKITALTIPIISAKILPSGPVVFTVSSSTLQAHPIVLGSILGDQVVVASGLTADMQIVTDARGLSDGQVVTVDATEATSTL